MTNKIFPDIEHKVFLIKDKSEVMKHLFQTNVRIERDGKWYKIFVSDEQEVLAFKDHVELHKVNSAVLNMFLNKIVMVQHLYVPLEKDLDTHQISEQNRILVKTLMQSGRINEIM